MSLQTRPTPPHLTSAMAENILAAACESETRKAAKRMRLEIYQTSQVCCMRLEVGEGWSRQHPLAGRGKGETFLSNLVKHFKKSF